MKYVKKVKRETSYEIWASSRIEEGKAVPKDVDWARLAAYIDGEGTIGINRGRKRLGGFCYDPTLTVANSDMRLISWLVDTFGGKPYPFAKQKHSRRQLWVWRPATLDTHWVVEQCLPYFIAKRDQAEILIAFEKVRRPYRWNPKVPVAVMEEKDSMYSKLRELKSPAASERVALEVGYVQ